MKAIYICSTGHSGSTLLDMILGSHPQIGSLGEVVMLPMDMDLHTKCTCDADINTCDVWSKVISTLSSQYGVDFRLKPELLDLGFVGSSFRKASYMKFGYVYRGRALRLTRSFLLRHFSVFSELVFSMNAKQIDKTVKVYEAFAKVANKDVVVDSSKVYLRAIELYRKMEAGLKTIFLVRDGRAVTASYMRHGFSLQASVDVWLNHNSRSLPLLHKYINEKDFMVLRYEDLITNPERELKRICQLVGIEYQEAMLDFTSTLHHNVSGNNIRFLKSSKLVLDEKWRKVLSSEQLAYFENRAGSMNRQFGYAE